MVARADGAAIGEIRRRFFRNRVQDAIANFGNFIQLRRQSHAGASASKAAACSFSFGTSASDRPSASNSRGPAVPSVSFASSRSRSRTFASSLRVSDRAMVASERCLHRVQPRLDLFELQARPQQSRAQHSAAHAGAGLIQHMNQRRLAAFAREQRLQQLQIPHRDRVQNHRLRAIVERRPVQMIQRRFLRVPQIVQDRARRGNRQRLASQAAAIQRQQAKMFAQRAVGIIQAEDPVLERGAQSRHIRRLIPPPAPRARSNSRAPRSRRDTSSSVA